MMFICEKFRSRTGVPVTADVLWDQIEEIYDINILTKQEMEKFFKRKSTDYSIPAEFEP